MLGLNAFGAQPGSESSPARLLEEILAANAVRVALERQRPVLQVGQNQIGDIAVIIQHIALGVAFVGIIDLLEIGELEGAAVDRRRVASLASIFHRSAVVRRLAHHRAGRLVLPQARDKPARADGGRGSSWRTSPGRPARASPTSCLRSGEGARRKRADWSVSSGFRRAARSSSVFWSKPVPTLPTHRSAPSSYTPSTSAPKCERAPCGAVKPPMTNSCSLTILIFSHSRLRRDS